MRPPVARAEPVRETRFGVTLDDPYRWMEGEQQDMLLADQLAFLLHAFSG
jgi:protease II